MTDLIERLRALSPVPPVGADIRLVWEEAADEIERLTKTETAIKRLFMGTRQWMQDGEYDQWDAFDFLEGRYSKEVAALHLRQGSDK